MRKKNCVKIAKKNNWMKIAGYTSKSEVRNSYSILFNLCGSPGFYHRCQIFVVRIKEIKCAFHFAASGWKSPLLNVVLYKIGKISSPWKMKKSWNSPGKVLDFCFPIHHIHIYCWFPLYKWSVMGKQVTSTPPPPNTWKWGGSGCLYLHCWPPVDREPAINVDMVNFRTNPVLTCCRWIVLSLNCFVPITTTVMLTVCYINKQTR